MPCRTAPHGLSADSRVPRRTARLWLPYGGRFWFGGLQVRVVPEPSDQLVGGGHRFCSSRRSARLVDPLQLPEIEEGDLSLRDFLEEQIVGVLRVAECPCGAFEPPVVSGDAEREGRLELRGVVPACGQRCLSELGQRTPLCLLVRASSSGTSTAGAQYQRDKTHQHPERMAVPH